MQRLGIIGSGRIGSAVARLAVAAEIHVVVANSRGPESLADFIAELGLLASAGSVRDAAEAGDLVLLSVPLTAYAAIPTEGLQGKTMLDTSNYYPFRDGRVPQLDSHGVTTSELVQAHFDGVPLVKAFNNIMSHHIPQLARPVGAADRSALPIASDDEVAKAEAAALIDRIGFDTVDVGLLVDSWKFEPESDAYTQLYLADPDTPMERMPEAPSAPVPATKLQAALARAGRVRVADRKF
ncbi:NADPH-dependent F420 reductase [Pseudarthrobacter sp. NPDC058196]|uniref:NADPH-dependent F420 reductase n=1 Tax=Pseudarthrobacter sp. NPDC058196 TaxID=3346376 RepID=UPI0036DA7A05